MKEKRRAHVQIWKKGGKQKFISLGKRLPDHRKLPRKLKIPWRIAVQQSHSFPDLSAVLLRTEAQKMSPLKGTLMQIWISVNTFVFTLKHFLLFEIYAHEICEEFVYKHSETIEYAKN